MDAVDPALVGDIARLLGDLLHDIPRLTEATIHVSPAVRRAIIMSLCLTTSRCGDATRAHETALAADSVPRLINLARDPLLYET